jgi:hypothetical protein
MQEKTIFALNGKKDSSLYLACFDGVRQHQHYWNKWILSDAWIDIINDRYELPSSLQFNSADLNRAIGRHPRFISIDTGVMCVFIRLFLRSSEKEDGSSNAMTNSPWWFVEQMLAVSFNFQKLDFVYMTFSGFRRNSSHLWRAIEMKRVWLSKLNFSE